MSDDRAMPPPRTPVGLQTPQTWRLRSVTKNNANEDHLSSPSSPSDPHDQHESNKGNDNPSHRNFNFRKNLVRSSRSLVSWLFSLLSFFTLSKLIVLGIELVKILLIPIRHLSTLIFPVKEFDGVGNLTIADKAAKAFIQDLYKKFTHTFRESDVQCPFVDIGYMNTLSEIVTITQRFNSTQSPSNELEQEELLLAATSIPPLLLIYLHSPLHRHATSFLSDKLFHHHTLDLLNHHRSQGSLICWGASIHTADGASVASTLGATSFPLLAMVRVVPSSTSISSSSTASTATASSRLELYLRIQGPVLINLSVSMLHQYMATTLIRYEQKLSQTRLQTLTRIQERKLRQEQDYEYQKCLEEDLKKAKMKALEEERLRVEENKARLEEEEKRVQLEREQLEKERILQEAKRLVERSNSMDAKNTTRIRFVLPSGQRLEQKFNVEDTVSTLRAYILLYMDEKFREGSLQKPITNFDLVCNYPKKILADENFKLQDVDGLCPHAVVMIQDLDV